MKYITKIVAFIVTVCMMLSMIPSIAFAEENSPLIIASNTKILSGSNVEVEIVLKDNPGIVSLTMKIFYDTDVLTLKSVEDLGMLGEQSHKPELESPYTLAWVNDTAQQNIVYNGVIARLVFTVSQDIDSDLISEIELFCDPDNFDVYDKNLNKVAFTTISGMIDVKSQIAHDLNNDTKCNAFDLNVLRKSLFNDLTFDDDFSSRADFNSDDNVDIIDLVVFKKLLLGYT